jgi:hypothetical protein
VAISGHPTTAVVSIDEGTPEPVNMGISRSLTAGRHRFVFSLPREDPCCAPRTYVVDVLPDEGKGPQPVHGIVKYRDAQLSFVGGPSDATLTCSDIGAKIPSGSSTAVPMTDVDKFVNCWIEGTGIISTQRRLLLKAGKVEVVSAPEPR